MENEEIKYTNIKEYERGSVLGKGTFGTVYMVRRKRDFKPFVIKQQDLSEKGTASFEMVVKEVQCLKRMRHPNIVAYHAAWTEDNSSYILMEYASCGTLKDLLEWRNMPLVEEDALYLFSQITLGVHHIHTKKILHRDLKPENILLTGRQGDIVKIGDFGVSKNLLEESLTCRAGSYYYMAPEMLFAQFYDLKCDIWSMGVLLYEMVTKTLPFFASSLDDVTKMVCTAKPRPPGKNVSKSVINLISKMLRKQAAYRPRAEQLLLCPYLIPFISKVHLNVGRIPNVAYQNPYDFSAHTFLRFLRSSRSFDKDLS